VSILAAAPALAQRVQFATPVAGQPGTDAPAAVPQPTSPYTQPYVQQPATSAAPPMSSAQPPAYPQPPAYTPPPVTYGQAPAGTLAQPPALSPYPTQQVIPPPGTAPPSTFGQPIVTPGAPSTAPAFAPVPRPAYGTPAPATLGGTIQPPANFDPYATPGTTPTPLLQQDPYLQCGPSFGMATMQKFLQHIDFDYHWFVGNPAPGNQELGIDDVEISATFAWPIFFNSQTPLLITPGFAVHYWSGPTSVMPTPPAVTPWPADLPARTYDAYLDAAWNPRITDWFDGELDARYGMYSDFTKFVNDSLRFTGKGMAVLTFSPHIKIKAGVWYLNRNVVKILPAGGICWTPNSDVYFNIYFPNPKIGKRLTTWGTTEWWLYASGDYGGGKWAIERNNGFVAPNPFAVTNGAHDTFDYNDIRVAVGLEFKSLRQLTGIFEVGGAFSRELVYQSTLPSAYYPSNTVFLRAGLSY
jgi:hypothetical protein